MPPSSAGTGGEHVYRTGLSSACRSHATRDRLRSAVSACHIVKFTTLEILAAYAARLAETGADWELTNKSAKEIQNLQSFLVYPKNKADKLPPILKGVALDYLARFSDARLQCAAFSKDGLSEPLVVQARGIGVAFSNLLEYGADALHRRWAMAVLGLSKAEARAVAACLGSSEAERQLRAKEALLRRLAREEEREEARDAAAAGEYAPQSANGALLSRATTGFDATRRAKVVSALARMAPRLPVQEDVVSRFRYRATLVRELDAALDAMEQPCTKRATLVPRSSFTPGFIRVFRNSLKLLGLGKGQTTGEHWMLQVFHERPLKHMLTGATCLGLSFLTDGIQLQISVISHAVASRKLLCNAAAVSGRKEAARKRSAGEILPEQPPKKKPKRAAREAAASKPQKRSPSAATHPEAPRLQFAARTGVDPGHSNVYTAHRVFPDGSHQTWSLSKREYYHRTGATARRARILKAKRRQPEVSRIETELGSLVPRASNLRTQLQTCASRMAAFQRLSKFYSSPPLMRLNFDSAMRKERLLKSEARRLAPTKDHQVFWGDAKFSICRAGTQPAACALIRRALAARIGARLVAADEFRTSCTCSKCFSPMENAYGQCPRGLGRDNVTHSEGASPPKPVQRKLHGVMQCRRSGCGRTWDRDKNAAINILYVAIHGSYAGNLHPRFWRRQAEQALRQ